MYEYTVNGKRVTFKARLPLRESRDMPKLLRASEADDYDSQVRILTKLIESWEFDGNPSDPESYEDLDVFSDLVPITRAAVEYIETKLGTDVKN